jgi:hypothetical protein
MDRFPLFSQLESVPEVDEEPEVTPKRGPEPLFKVEASKQSRSHVYIRSSPS